VNSGTGSGSGTLRSPARLTGQTVGAVTISLLFTLASAGNAPRIELGIAASLALIAGLVSTLRSAITTDDLPGVPAAPVG
jgi:MFS transporter, DHA2 family, multidrug resistance protein